MFVWTDHGLLVRLGRLSPRQRSQLWRVVRAHLDFACGCLVQNRAAVRSSHPKPEADTCCVRLATAVICGRARLRPDVLSARPDLATGISASPLISATAASPSSAGCGAPGATLSPTVRSPPRRLRLRRFRRAPSPSSDRPALSRSSARPASTGDPPSSSATSSLVSSFSSSGGGSSTTVTKSSCASGVDSTSRLTPVASSPRSIAW